MRPLPAFATSGTDQRDGMCLVRGGTFAMGSTRFYAEEAPVRRVSVDAFWIDEAPVTNRAFAAFVDATGYLTEAETAPDPKLYPGMDPSLAQPGSLVFRRTAGPVPLDDYGRWWEFTPGADWRHPCGPESDLDRLCDHPVVHISHADARSYAGWAGKSLPTEAEWEFAARGGIDGADFAWGDTLEPGGGPHANYWQGAFPFANTLDDGWELTSPVRSYSPNGYGLFDMIGNVWEWTADWFALPRIERKAKGSCCVPANPRGGNERASRDPAFPDTGFGRKVVKGGSFLCAPSYCQRYRPAARQPQMVDTSTSHIGFRCVVRHRDTKEYRK